jgi:Ser/Thr protein kinase RdoA (MazF antagonist)
MTLNAENAVVLARLALAEFGFDPASVPLTFVKMRENTVFRADTPGGPIALRLHRPGYRQQREIAAESELIELLAARGFPVVRLVPTPSGAYTAVVSDGETEVVVDAQRWLEGSRQLGGTEDAEGVGALDERHFESMGRLAARMHQLAEELAGAHRFPRQPWDAEGLVGERALWGDALAVQGLDDDGRRRLARARAMILEELAEFGTAPSVYGYIHADFTPENVLVSGDELVVIDFDDFGEGWYLFDLATVLFFFLEQPDYEAFRAGLLRGYRNERPLDAREEELLDMFLVARGFTYLGWAATRPETETAQFLVDTIVPLVVRLAAGLVEPAE